MRLSAELGVLASAPQATQLTSALSLQTCEVVEKTGVRLRHAAGILDAYAGEFEADYGEGHRDPMVVIGLDRGVLDVSKAADRLGQLADRDGLAVVLRAEPFASPPGSEPRSSSLDACHDMSTCVSLAGADSPA